MANVSNYSCIFTDSTDSVTTLTTSTSGVPLGESTTKRIAEENEGRNWFDFEITSAFWTTKTTEIIPTTTTTTSTATTTTTTTTTSTTTAEASKSTIWQYNSSATFPGNASVTTDKQTTTSTSDQPKCKVNVMGACGTLIFASFLIPSACFWHGKDYGGYDLNNGFANRKDSAEECQQFCQEHPDCVGFTWVYPNATWSKLQNNYYQLHININ